MGLKEKYILPYLMYDPSQVILNNEKGIHRRRGGILFLKYLGT